MSYINIPTDWLKRDDIELLTYYQYASVSIIIKDNSILLEKRNSALNDPWAGQFALPGGHYEKGDATLFRTAVREVYEETGIELKEKEYQGYFGPFSPRNKSDLMVITFVFSIEKNRDLKLVNSTESEFLVWVDIRTLINKRGLDDDGPVYIINEGTIWGMTARIIDKFLMMCKLYEK